MCRYITQFESEVLPPEAHYPLNTNTTSESRKNRPFNGEEWYILTS
jgi:hypothetical protein